MLLTTLIFIAAIRAIFIAITKPIFLNTFFEQSNFFKSFENQMFAKLKEITIEKIAFKQSYVRSLITTHFQTHSHKPIFETIFSELNERLTAHETAV